MRNSDPCEDPYEDEDDDDEEEEDKMPDVLCSGSATVKFTFTDLRFENIDGLSVTDVLDYIKSDLHTTVEDFTNADVKLELVDSNIFGIEDDTRSWKKE